MEAQLLLHEGLRTSAYLDTEGYWTVGVGYNLSGRGTRALEDVIGRRVGDDLSKVVITRDEALKMLRADIRRVVAAVRVAFTEFDSLDDVRQRVVVDMAFNMAYKALTFKAAIDAIRRRDWSRASRELYKSKWSRQVGDGPGGKFDRADRLANMLLTGQDYIV